MDFQSSRVLTLFRRSYVLALALVGCLLIGLVILSQRRLVDQQDDAALINLAGRQRMLSQRLSKELLLRQQGERPADNLVPELLGQWNEAHTSLKQRAHSEGARALFTQLDPLVNSMTSDAESYLSKSNPAELNRFLRQEGEFLGLMEALVGTFELEASARVQRHINLQWLTLSLLLLTLTVEAVFIFRPLTTRLKSTLEGLTEANRETEEALLESRKAERLKGEFLANVSHEIRTPMNGIIGMSELLLEREVNPDNQEYARIIHHSAEALLCILNDLLDMSKIQAGEFQLHTGTFDLLAEVDEVVELQAVVAAGKGLEVLVDVTPRVPNRVVGDRYRFRQVLLNLLSNAVKFTDVGHVLLQVETAVGGVKFTVSDTGPGVSSDDLERIFQPFSQLDGSHTRAHMGTGLGLSIASNLVRLMEGEIGVESEPGDGAIFWFWLPLEGVAEKPEVANGLQGKRFLVVDDVAANRLLLRTWIEEWGGRFFEAKDGAEALIIGSKDNFDFILLDYQMPGMHGIQVAKELRRGDARMVALPSILEDDTEKFREVGFHGLVRKPLRRRILELLLTSLLDEEVRFASPDSIDRIQSQAVVERVESLQVLIVDDIQLNCNVAGRFVKRLGFHSVAALSGQEAINKCQQREFDLVLMDLQMPEMDGFETTLRLRQQGFNNLIVALTANALPGVREQCLEAGMDDFLLKPLSKESLLRIVDEHLGRKIIRGS